MKITEIEVGKVYFSSTSQDWQHASWGVKKVRVLVAKNSAWEWDRLAKTYKESHGFRSRKGIVVEVLNDNGTVVETTVVPLGSIKGLWDVVAPVVAGNRQARQDAENAQTARNKVAYDLVWANRQKAQELGLKGVTTNGTHNEVSPETMAMLLDLWAAHRAA